MKKNKKLRSGIMITVLTVLSGIFISSIVYGEQCPMCNGLGWYICPGESYPTGNHIMGDNTYWDEDEQQWECGYCDGIGDHDPDYEEVECSLCGYIGSEGDEVWCDKCDKIINHQRDNTHLVRCSCQTTSKPTEKPVPTATPKPNVTPRPTRKPTATPTPTTPACDHNWSDYIALNEKRHQRECFICSKTQTGNHSFTTETFNGTTTKRCSRCGYEIVNHTCVLGDWQYDSIGHWKECINPYDDRCWERQREAAHTYGAWEEVTGGKRAICTVCQYVNFVGNQYSVSFHANCDDYTGSMATQNFTYGTAQNLRKNAFQREITIRYNSNTGSITEGVEYYHNEQSRSAGFDFIGWTMTPDGSPKFADAQMVNNLTSTDGGNIPLYACWGNARIKLPFITWDDRVFLGWKINNEGALLAADTVVEITEACEIWAQWKPVYYNVTFDTQGGTPCEDILVTVNNPYGNLPETEKEGHVFLGWKIQGTNTYVTDVTRVTINSDHVLVAVWRANSYTVTFDWNFDYNAAAVNPMKNFSGDTATVIFSEKYGILPAPSREGYTFIGWFLEETANNGTGQMITTGMDVFTPGNHTLYACWQNRDKSDIKSVY